MLLLLPDSLNIEVLYSCNPWILELCEYDDDDGDDDDDDDDVAKVGKYWRAFTLAAVLVGIRNTFPLRQRLMGEFRAEKRVVIAHQMEWIRDEGLKKLVKSSIWKSWPISESPNSDMMDIMDFSRIDFEYDTHRVCFYLSLRYAFSHPQSSVPSSGTSVIVIVAVLSTIISKNHWVFKVETSSREKMRLPKLLAQVGLGRKRIYWANWSNHAQTL